MLITTLFLLWRSGFPLNQKPNGEVFLTEHAGVHQWCATLDKQMADEDTDRMGALTVANASYESGHLKSIDINSEDEAGDWMVYDHYSINKAARSVQSLKRVINSASGDATVTKWYRMRSQKARLIRSSAESLSNSSPLNIKEVPWLPSLRIYVSLREIPFRKLLPVDGPPHYSQALQCMDSRRH